MHHSFASIEEAFVFYETLLEHLGVDFAMVDENKKILCLTQTALESSLSKEDVVGKNLFTVFPHLVSMGFPQAIDRVLAAGKPHIELYVHHTTASGYSGYFHRKFIPVDVEGAGRAVVMCIENVNEQRLAEVHARESEFRYQRLIETMNLVSFRLDASGKFTYINNASLKIFEWSPAEMLDTSFVQYVHPEDISNLWRVFWQVVNREEEYGVVENRILTRTGALKHMRWNIHPIYDEQGKIIGSQGVGEDITQKQEMMVSLQQSYGKYKGFFNALPVPVCIMSKEDRIVSANRSMCKLLLFSQKEMQEKTIFDILPVASLPKLSRIWQQFKEKGGMSRQRFSIVRKDRTTVNIVVNGVRFGVYYMLIAERVPGRE